MNWFNKLLIPPIFADEAKTRTARLLNTILLVSLLLGIIGSAFVLLITPDHFIQLSLPGVLLLIILGSYVLMRLGYVSGASFIFVFGYWVAFTVFLTQSDGVYSFLFSGYILITFLAAILLGNLGGILFAILAVATGGGLLLAEQNGLIVETLTRSDPLGLWLANAMFIVVVVAVLYLNNQGVTETLDRVKSNEQKLIESNAKLETVRTTLEERISVRTRGLRVVAALSENLGSILELNHLLAEIVNRIKENFNYNHVHIYLLDTQGENLSFAEGTGESAKRMKTEGHQVTMSARNSLIARAARSGQVMRVDNIQETREWLSNPLLPDTHAEMAVPIILKNQVVGVLDVQQNQVAALNEDDADLLRSLANQVAVAINNARLFAEVETALAEARALQKRYVEQSWSKANLNSESRDYLYVQPDVPELADTVMQQVERYARQQNSPKVVAVDGQNVHTIAPDVSSTTPTALVAPITLGNQAIGTLQLHQTNSGQQSTPWSEEDMAMIQIVLDQVAQTADNLRLFDQTNRQAANEQTIREITDKLRNATNLDSLLETAARELGQRLAVPHTILELGIEN